MSPQKPTAASFKGMAEKRFGENAAEFLKLYPAANDDEALVSAETLSGDDFVAFSTWKWMDFHSRSGATVYQYHFEQVPKAKPGEKIGTITVEEAGARHACEIEYVFQTLKLAHEDTPWADDDFKVSAAMATYWTNFVKTGNPNHPSDGKSLPNWPGYKGGTAADPSSDASWIMHLSGKKLGASPDTARPRYLFLDAHSTPIATK
jgi:para-nitrobenzyl esterase